MSCLCTKGWNDFFFIWSSVLVNTSNYMVKEFIGIPNILQYQMFLLRILRTWLVSQQPGSWSSSPPADRTMCCCWALLQHSFVFIVLKPSSPFQVETGGKGFCHENGVRFQFREMRFFVVVVVVVVRFYMKAVLRCRKLILNYIIL